MFINDKVIVAMVISYSITTYSVICVHTHLLCHTEIEGPRVPESRNGTMGH